MIAVIQRVLKAQVSVDKKAVGRIKTGYLILLGVVKGDTNKDLSYLVKKISQLRLMPDNHQKMNLNLSNAHGSILVISQFTLAGNVQKGNRPSFINAADPQLAQKYYQQFVTQLKLKGLTVKSGCFGAYMQVELTNDGPTTLIIDSQKDLS